MADAIVIGAGQNGLVAANHLADRGWSVTVLEANSEPGGAVRSGQITVPGFTHDLFSAFYPLAVASPAIVDLELERYGLRWRQSPLVLAHPLPDGRCATLSTQIDQTAANLDGFAAGDGDGWRRLMSDWNDVSDQFLNALLRPFPPVRAAASLLRQLKVGGTLRFVRHALLPVRRMAEEFFSGEGGGLLLGGSALHADLCPEAAGSGLYGWLLCCLGQTFGFPVPEGGAGMLTQAMVRRLESRGGQVLCGKRVTKVIIRGGRAVGAITADGDEVSAGRAVLADVTAPALYTELIDREHLPSGLFADLRHFQWDTSTVKIDWALRRPVPWAAPEAAEAGTVHIADDFNNLTEFTAHLAMGQIPARPFLLFGQQSRADPTRAPEGAETAWAYTHVPRTIRGDAGGEVRVDPGSGEDAWLPAFMERIENRVEAMAPGFRDSILGRHCFSPSGLEEADANLVGGAINGGTAQIHQQLVFRPVPGLGRADTPVPNLFLASASAHPGGGVHGAAGANAAMAAIAGWSGARARLLRLSRRGSRRAPNF
ncbi:MAG TPA: NAD(P)/FAD-dependent oxidoreductase [Acidimicrobiales bacterium]|jgi:phytoene dehydrogenase-like protein|nr:NAD(P)/FAD-dependent oxidoreductase [Acidimicrobiales bacterium]